MTRVHHQRPQRGARQSSAALEQPRAALRTKKKKKFKIVLEAVTQEKKKLRSILSYAANAPPDFGFIPVGHPELTEWCKEQCRQRRLDVHVVSAKPKNNIRLDPAKLSHHVHRIGHHFPLEIIELGCKRFDYAYDGVGGLRKVDPGEDAKWYTQRVEDYSSRQALQGKPVDETLDYIRGAVRELFPKIPEADLTSIVTHAFAKGTERVGNAKDISLARRIQLAVGAHIRHTRTDYDKLLKTVGYMDARRIVEPDSLAKLLEWRDEAGGDSHELEETFREVIIIDDEDMSSDEDESIDTPDERDQSMEIVSSRATAQELQPDRHSVYPRIDNRDASRASGRIIVVGPYAPPPRAAARPAPANLEIAAQEPYTQHRQAYPPSSRAAAHPAPVKREITAQEPYVQHRQAPEPR
ncbi:hypothetical protein IQ07DRAFT_500923 [Pyrenochaeta sp. DS3sAY3a]|nr:hypothetical protein IQ07DRAFT_500923 [Pyrenochaeta sp. DS3sAY3a]